MVPVACGVDCMGGSALETGACGMADAALPEKPRQATKSAQERAGNRKGAAFSEFPSRRDMTSPFYNAALVYDARRGAAVATIRLQRERLTAGLGLAAQAESSKRAQAVARRAEGFATASAIFDSFASVAFSSFMVC